LAAVMAGSAVAGGFPALPSGAAGADTPPGPPSAGQGSLVSRVAGTWGACGSWWSETASESTSGSVCGIDGLVTENGQPTQLVEPLISVSRYTCRKRTRAAACRSESYEGPVRRTEMTVDPFLRRATIRGALGGCALDLEFAGVGPVQPQGNLSEWHSLTPGAPQLTFSGGQTSTTQASWWGRVCGQLVVPPPDEQAQAWIFRGIDASITGFGGQGGGGCGCERNGCAAMSRPVTAC
jgi:hypothetical protein